MTLLALSLFLTQMLSAAAMILAAFYLGRQTQPVDKLRQQPTGTRRLILLPIWSLRMLAVAAAVVFAYGVSLLAIWLFLWDAWR